MRTTIEIDEELVNEVMRISKVKTIKGAIVTAFKEYIKAHRKRELRDMIGNYNEFGLTLEELEKMRGK